MCEAALSQQGCYLGTSIKHSVALKKKKKYSTYCTVKRVFLFLVALFFALISAVVILVIVYKALYVHSHPATTA